jgi:broad specificity phosphatase PhoE
LKLYLVRHAQTSGNAMGALDTALPGPPLTDLGQTQALALADGLGEEPIVAIYASQAIRTQQTAAPLASRLGLDVQVIDGVKEVDAGDLEGRTDREAILVYLEAVRQWTQGALGVGIPGGETGEQVRSRMLDAVARLRAKHEQADPNGVVVLVSHGGTIRLSAEWLADNVPPEVANSGLIPNTGIVALDALPDDGGWRCLSWAENRL